MTQAAPQSSSSVLSFADSGVPSQGALLSADAQALLIHLHEKFDARRKKLLSARRKRQMEYDQGELPDFRIDTQTIRVDDWKIAGIPQDIQDRRVEITGPVDRKMVINALNSGAKCFMADFEDATSPTWFNMVDGQQNMKDAVDGSIAFEDETSGKSYALNDDHAVLLVRPRGLHLDEAHGKLNGEALSGSLFDFALYLFHNHQALKAKNSGAYYYLPKLETMEEAAWWEDVINEAENYLGLPQGFVKVTVLIETITATFEAEEILHALRPHIVALNCGRWDYIFSYIKKFRAHHERMLPDRAQVTMSVPFMDAYSKHVIYVCHKRGAQAMGGMAAQIPIKGDDKANAEAMAKVKADKQREAINGHDGTWVAHPALIPIAMEVFDKHMPKANQIDKQITTPIISNDDLLAVPEGTITEEGVRGNIQVGILYLAAWLNGQGCVPIHNLMEDAATAEISRAQCWQWRRHGAELADGRILGEALFDALFNEEAEKLKTLEGTPPTLEAATAMFYQQCTARMLDEFLTLPAYQQLTKN